MNPLFEAWKLAVMNGSTGNNRALTSAVDSAGTPDTQDKLRKLKELYRPLGKTKTGPIEPNVGVPEAG